MIAKHAQLMRLATRAALAVAVTLVIAKAVAYWLSGSVSLLAGLTDSLLDSAASLLNLVAVSYALRPADDDHRFGHGKAEALAGLAQALLIGSSAVLVAIQALEQIRQPVPISAQGIGLWVMAASLGLTLLLLSFQRYVVRVTQSRAIEADALHYQSDVLLNISIIAALALSRLGVEQADGVFGVLIGGYIFYSAVKIARDSIKVLMDAELDTAISAEMLELAKGVSDVLDVVDLRTRVAGNQWFVQLNAVLPKDMRLECAHARCLEIERRITERFPQCEVLVHADPFGAHA